MAERKISCTGIKPTGTPHIGNYFGAMLPAIKLSREYDARYFIADYHALNSLKDPAILKQYTYEVAAAWLACGLDPDRSLIYRQSSVPGTFELTTILLCFTPKGLMNRAHAYKALVAGNEETGHDPDDGVNMGLFTYPILMAADILQFDSDVVPVGRDQAQHLEMTIDIAEYFNKNYNQELLKIPRPLIQSNVETIPGLDGRKMSKSYDNYIPLFCESKQLRKMIMKIVTNSQTVEEPKNPDDCNIFALYRLFAEPDEISALAQRYRTGGMGWGEAKQALYEVAERIIAPLRDKYQQILSDKAEIDKILDDGSRRAQEIVSAKLRFLRHHIGI
ncbi:MAG: tryptophan--tRNA ligase [Candidatus Cloacimonetes bacterium]|nr:tryptophan--tRNA ligase [Candidatus Cloacimonadota bacterium]